MRLVKRFAVLVGRCHYVENDGLYNYCGVPEPKSKKNQFMEKAKAIIAICSFQYHCQ